MPRLLARANTLPLAPRQHLPCRTSARRVAAVATAVYLALLCCRAAAGPQPTCAVLAFDPGPSLTAWQTTLFCNKFAAAATRSPDYALMSRYEVNRQLQKLGFSRSITGADRKTAVAAGRLLEVDFVVHGDIQLTGGRYVVTTSLVSVRTGLPVESIGSQYAGTWEQFIRRVPERAAEALFGLPRLSGAPSQRHRTPVAPEGRHRPTAGSGEPSILSKAGARISVWWTDLGRRFTQPRRPATPRWRPVPTAAGPTTIGGRARQAVADHLDLGARVTRFSLVESTKDTFLGTINGLDGEQTLLPRLYATWHFSPQWGMELAWESLRVKTRTTPDGISDGDFTLKGPLVTGFGRYVNPTPWTPFAGVGLAFLRTDFDADAWWSLGFSSPDNWEAEGSPNTTITGVTQDMDLDNTVGLVLQGGCEYRITPNWTMDVYVRRVNVDVKTRHTVYMNREPLKSNTTTRDIPMAHYGFGVGLRYTF